LPNIFKALTPHLPAALEIRVRIRVRLEDALFLAFFTENKEKEHLFFGEFH